LTHLCWLLGSLCINNVDARSKRAARQRAAVHYCNPSYLGGRVRRMASLKLAQAKFRRPPSKKIQIIELEPWLKW
jgi:hypothetical protein